ncbi:MAG: peptide chain release factor N(5)-glutamine methyltransferase [Acidobacteriota bacterium]
MTIAAAAAAARARFVEAGIAAEEAALDAELLARHVLGWDRATWLARVTETPPPAFERAYDALVRRREAREPVAYIRGVQEFWSRAFLVGPAVLIPRPETEFVVEEALASLAAAPSAHAGVRVVDVGTGSGCLAVTLAAERPYLHVVATDISEAALDVARANARRFEVDDRVTFIRGPYLAGTAAPLDLIVANPPYVADADEPALAPEVRAFEPRAALFGGPDGLRDIRAILEQAAERLAPGGGLVMEIGMGQARDVERAVARHEALALTRLRTDLQGIPRVAVVTRR